MQYELILTGKFKKSLKLAKRTRLGLRNLLDEVVTMLQNEYSVSRRNIVTMS